MGLLAGAAYDPASAGSIATTGATVMTALDTTNLRLTFTAPLNGIVRVRMRCITTGATTTPVFLLGVLDGATVKGRQAPMCVTRGVSTTSAMVPWISEFTVSGLTAGTSYTWDAAYGVETGVASTAIKYGGPNNTSTGDAYGAFNFEVYDAPEVLATTMYDPAGAVTKAVSSALAMTAVDTTNLRLTFTGPPSGNVIVRMGCPGHGGVVTNYVVLLGVLDGATVKARQRATAPKQNNTAAATDYDAQWARMLVTGLTPGTSYTWDAAYGVEVVAASTSLVYGGPDNTSTDDAYGGFLYEIIDASSVKGLGAMV